MSPPTSLVQVATRLAWTSLMAVHALTSSIPVPLQSWSRQTARVTFQNTNPVAYPLLKHSMAFDNTEGQTPSWFTRVPDQTLLSRHHFLSFFFFFPHPWDLAYGVLYLDHSPCLWTWPTSLSSLRFQLKATSPETTLRPSKLNPTPHPTQLSPGPGTSWGLSNYSRKKR